MSNDKIINSILIQRDMDISEIRKILRVSDGELFTLLIKKYRDEILDYDSENVNLYKRLKNISSYLTLISNKSIEVDNRRMVNNIIKKIQYKMRKILTDDEEDEFIIELYNELESIKNMIVDKNSIVKEDNYDFLLKVIDEIRDSDVINNLLNKYPHYVNLKNSNGKHIIISLFDELTGRIKSNAKVKDILYYEKVLELFLYRERTKFESEDITRIENELNKTLEYIDNYYSTTTKYSQLKSGIELLKIKFLQSNISQENLKLLSDKYDIKSGFSDSAVDELNIILKDYSKYIAPIITVDSDDAVCLDDAYQITKKGNYYRVKVFIANGGGLIKHGSVIDKEASHKFSNIYLPNSVINMIPVELSNNVFSLNVSGRKSVIEYNILFDNDANIIDFEITDVNIHVDNNLNYDYVNGVINGDNTSTYNIENSLALLSEVAILLRSKNKEKEKYRMMSDVVKTVIGRNLGKNKYKERTTAEIINEEFMVLINYLSARIQSEKNYPYIYRINQKIDDIEYYEKFLNIAHEKNIYDVDSILNGFAKSKYSINSSKHEGLNLDYYSHSSSPLRRYPDMINQRILKDLVIDKNEEKIEYWYKFLEENIELYNEREKRNNDFLSDTVRFKNLVKRLGGNKNV